MNITSSFDGVSAIVGVEAVPAIDQALAVRSFGLTDIGQGRDSNQDQFVIAALIGAMWIHQSSFPQTEVQYGKEAGRLFVVADGMDGPAGGEQASALAVGTIETLTLGALRWLFGLGTEGEILHEFKSALRQADQRVCDEASRSAELRGMGTTLTMAYSIGSTLFVAHAGDSRCYLMRDGDLHLLTEDHTLVNSMVQGGLIDIEHVAQHSLRHVVTNAVGGTSLGVQAELHKAHLLAGDTVLLCTDGLTETLDNKQIAAILTQALSPRVAAETLVASVNSHGGEDNVTVIVAQYQAAPIPGAPS